MNIEIAKAVNRSCSTVYSIIKNIGERKTLIYRERIGRSRKLSNREEREIIKTVKKNPKLSASEIAANCWTILVQLFILKR